MLNKLARYDRGYGWLGGTKYRINGFHNHNLRERANGQRDIHSGNLADLHDHVAHFGGLEVIALHA